MSGEDEIITTLGVNYAPLLGGLGIARDELGRFQKMAVDTGTRGAQALKAAEAGLGGMTSRARALRPAIQDVGSATAKTAKSLQDMQKESAQLMRLQALLGPQLGGIVKTLGMVRGTQASGLTGATLAVGAFAAGLAAVVAIGGSAVSVYADVAAYSAQIEHAKGEGLISAEEVENIEKAGRAFTGLSKSFGDFQIVLAGTFADDFSSFSLGLDYVLSRIEGFDADEATERARKFHNELNGIKESLSDGIPEWMRQNGQGNHKVTADEQKAADGAAASAAAAAKASSDAALTAAKAQSVAVANTWIFLMDSLDAEAAATAKSEAETWAWLGDQMDAENKAATDAAIAEMNREHEAFVATAEHRLEVEQANEKAIAAARKQAAQDAITASSQVTASLLGFGTQLVDAQVANTEEGTEAHRRALRDQLTMQEGAAIANAALGITNIWSQWAAQPIVAAALTLIEVGATGAAIGQLESQKAKMHTGGLAADEQYGMPQVITRSNEAYGVLTAEGQRHLTADDFGRANAGVAGPSQRLEIIVRDESGRKMSGRQFARPQPQVGQTPRTVR